MLGIHKSQMALIEKEYAGGVPDYLITKLRRVFTETSIQENYFWRVYIQGAYTRQCCPNYLKEENFSVLRERVDRVRVVTGTVTELLRSDPGPFTHVTLLDHQDWLACYDAAELEAEWRALLARTARQARILLRSAGLALDFLPAWLQERVRFAPERTGFAHRLDRVGTYGSLHLAEVQ
jgi:S-adenosylmethionine-diacylglycerol 3-amino-3-carboxypropyl transferase